jgi:catechol 2,3-dioxygenase-like lactoylglutathione lyase family enzyme
MLEDAKAVPGFAVDDVAAAREFYGTTLGLEVAEVPLGVDGADVPAGLEIRIGAPGPGSCSTPGPATSRRPSRC